MQALFWFKQPEQMALMVLSQKSGLVLKGQGQHTAMEGPDGQMQITLVVHYEWRIATDTWIS
jgi:hypothetical protein